DPGAGRCSGSGTCCICISIFVICHPRFKELNMAMLDVVVPQLSESVAEATMLTWKKKPGEAVAVDEILIEIETDKVVLEVPAPSAGVLAEIVKGDGATVTAGEVIARIDTEATASAAPAAAAAPAPAAVPSPA